MAAAWGKVNPFHHDLRISWMEEVAHGEATCFPSSFLPCAETDRRGFTNSTEKPKKSLKFGGIEPEFKNRRFSNFKFDFFLKF